MGLSDREYYRDDQPAGFQLGNQMMVTNIIIVTVAMFLLDKIIAHQDHWLMRGMAATPEVFGKPWMFWKTVTYGFAHSTRDIQHIFWNMFGLWLFGREVETLLGRKEFLRFYLAAIFFGGVVWCTREFFMVDRVEGALPPMLWGASGAVTAVILLFVFNYPKRTILLFMVLPVPAWLLGIIVIGGDLLGVMARNSDNVAFDVHLVGAAFAALYFRFHWNIGSWIPGAGRMRFKRPKFRSRPELKIHNPEEFYREQDAEADRVLEKVNQQGMDSLDPAEKRVLEDYSRRMRQKHR